LFQHPSLGLIEARILIYRKRLIKLEQPDPQQIHHFDQALSLIVDNLMILISRF
jgi:hypothetical protein